MSPAMREQAGAFGRRQIAVLLNEILQQNGNAGEYLGLSRRDLASLTAGPIEPLSHHGIEGGVQRFDAGDRSFANFSGADLAPPYDAGETESIMPIIVLGFHGKRPAVSAGPIESRLQMSIGTPVPTQPLEARR